MKAWESYSQMKLPRCYEDQCSPADPRLPMVADMEETMADAYYGYAERPGRRK